MMMMIIIKLVYNKTRSYEIRYRTINLLISFKQAKETVLLFNFVFRKCYALYHCSFLKLGSIEFFSVLTIITFEF